MEEYGVFIIESLHLEDEKNNIFDGYIIKQALDLYGVPNIYYYIRTVTELQEIISEFENSGFRYLHFSCHADTSQIELTFESLFYNEFFEIIGEKLNNKRIFLSACEATNAELAKELILTYNCYSLVGSPNKIGFSQSAVFWSGFYHLMYESSKKYMKQPKIKRAIKKLVNTFGIPINYYSFIRNNNQELREHLIRPNVETIRNTIF